MKYADEVIVLSKGVQDYFKKTYGRETHFIPNGVNRPQIREAKLITDHFGLEKDSYILFLGRLVPEKGIRYLVEAFKNVKTDKKLVIAGGSSDTDSFMEELKELAKGDDRILFTGFVQGAMLDELYSNAYIYTLPSDLEGMPLSLLEAMSYGNCCLVSDIPECAEVVEDKEYVDDGYSGTSTSRPAFQRLIQDAQDGKIKTIIVKDFSRFARDYIEAGDYMERIFPLLGVRFISVNDGYDSGMQAGNDVRGLEVAIKNIINASYSRDLSAKIAAADHVMQKKGMYLGGYRPFGFLPDPNDCHKLILDPVASQYVRLIFELALQGNRTGTIAKILNEKQIPTPAAFHVAENHVYSEQKAWDLQRSHWTSGTVYHVLKNEKYKGTYVGAKFIMPVPCKHRVLRAPMEQQVRIEDSHAAIVTPDEFEQAQKVIMLQHGNHQAGNYTKHQYPLKGKVYCGYCQKLMKYRVLKKLGPSFNCRFSAAAVDSPCKRIPISEKLLEHIVRNALTAQIKQAEYVLEILHERERKALICFSALDRQEEKLSVEKAEIVKQRVALYEQYADGNMSKEEFIRQRDAYRAQEDEQMEQIQRLRTEKNQIFQPVKKDTDNLQAVMNTVGEAGDVMHLSQNVVETFIDRIEVFNDECVKIRFTFEDVLKSYEAE